MRTNTFMGRFSLPENVTRTLSALRLKQHAIWVAVAILSLSVSGSSALAKEQLERAKHLATEAPMPFVTPSAPQPSVKTGSKLGAPPAECEVDPKFKKISKCIINTANDVVIGDGAKDPDCQTKVYIDTSVTPLGFVKINKNGVLKIFDRTAQLPMRIETTGIDVFGNLEVGDAKCPIGTINSADKVQFTFTGGPPDKNNKLCTKSPCPGYTKGIQVESLGTLRMYGIKGVSSPVDLTNDNLSWTYLSAAAGPAIGFTADDKVKVPVPTGGDKVLQLAYDVSPATRGNAGWKKGDWIAVATTSFSPWETEFVQLAKDAEKSGTGSTLTLNSPLEYYHFGGPDPKKPSPAKDGCDDKTNYGCDETTNFGVDERAEVGLISRSIKLTSDAPILNPPTLANHWGGEMKFIQGFKEVSIQGVELEKFGKEQLGSYPIHFHMDGDLSKTPVTINANSIHHSYNKCITVHTTQNLTNISNNVCGRITGSIFYEEIGDERNIAFTHNLGMGAMSNSWDVNGATSAGRCKTMMNNYWAGDKMAANFPGSGACKLVPPAGDISFDQIGIFDTGDQSAPVHGSCYQPSSNGGLTGYQGFVDDTHPIPPEAQIPKCAPPYVYFEMPTGFWITNPSTKLIGNSIAGCQDTGKAYYYVSPGGAVAGVENKWIPIGTLYATDDKTKYGVFDRNRAHGCYSGLYDEPEQGIVSDSLFGYEGGIHDSTHNAVADVFENFTFSRIRDRGIWVRPSFYVATNARAATVRDAVSLVTSGGVDGNYPGVWGQLRDSVVVGMSQNNVDRWGPCPKRVSKNPFGQVSGGEWGCIDQTNPNNTAPCDPLGNSKNFPKCTNAVNGAVFTERGYDSPDWPMFGFLIYDGPPLILHDRFVNFKVAPGSVAPATGNPAVSFPAANFLTKADDDVLTTWPFYALANKPPYKFYEGDAALGWFNANQSSYPAATTTDRLTFTNVDLRHQVYTAAVNRGDFTDGDQNTTILDLDGTLSGVTALTTDKKPIKLPSISLNNLPINASSNSVDECLATGIEDQLLEGRPTAAMEPSALGQLEFEQLYPNYTTFAAFKHTETLTFTKNVADFKNLPAPFPPNYHGSMALKSRDGKGTWEPKVTDGYGYTVTASKYISPGNQEAPPIDATCPPTEKPCSKPGIGSAVDLTLTDIVNAPAISAANPFYVQLGICYTNDDGTHPADMFTVTQGYRSYGGGNVVTSPDISDALKKNWTGFLKCNNLDFILTGGDDTKSNILPKTCPSASGNGDAVTTLTPVKAEDGIAGMTTNGKLNGPPNLKNYFYDSANGWLFLWVAQTEPNAAGESPLGNCKGLATDPDFCPGKTTGETYYVCPAKGCTSYRIVLNDTNYKPGPSKCGDPYGSQGYNWPGPPAGENILVEAGGTTKAEQTEDGGKGGEFPHYPSKNRLSCDMTTPIVP